MVYLDMAKKQTKAKQPATAVTIEPPIEKEDPFKDFLTITPGKILEWENKPEHPPKSKILEPIEPHKVIELVGINDDGNPVVDFVKDYTGAFSRDVDDKISGRTTRQSWVKSKGLGLILDEISKMRRYSKYTLGTEILSDLFKLDEFEAKCVELANHLKLGRKVVDHFMDEVSVHKRLGSGFKWESKHK